jgi:antibiotic biosynthesis monooxygenase (ABM) superfamily enzyme
LTQGEFTEVINRKIAAGHENEYDDWLQGFMISERQFSGNTGTTIIAPAAGTSSRRYVINRFADQASLDAWENT